MSEFITSKRWALRDGREESELLELVHEEIVPHFMKLPGCLRLGLLHLVGTRSYLALQYWQSRERWDEIMLLEEEWYAEELLAASTVPI